MSVDTININEHEFRLPQKGIKSVMEMKKWEKSTAYHDYLGCIMMLNEQVKGKLLTDNFHISQTISNLVLVLDKLSTWIDEIPPIDQPQRFGNKAFRQWFERLQRDITALLSEALPSEYSEACVSEVSVYLRESVGNSTRIDYGTGHEASFVMFLCCMFKIGVLRVEDAAAAVLHLFNRYLALCHKLQTVYKMEPAGSQGVWSLDDYQFIPFIWGSAQLIGQSEIRPSSFPEAGVADQHAECYMFMRCIQHISQTKTGPFAEHSNQLWNISGAASWEKINGGLIKMYRAEVLSKFPIIQHVMFGSLLTLDPAPPPTSASHPARPGHAGQRIPPAPAVFKPPPTLSTPHSTTSTDGK